MEITQWGNGTRQENGASRMALVSAAENQRSKQDVSAESIYALTARRRTIKSRRPPTNDDESTSDLLGGCLPRLVQPDLLATMKTKKLKLTPAMEQMLRDAWQHDNPHHSLRGMAAHGGATWTMRGLVKRGLMTKHGQVTFAGVDWLNAADLAPKGARQTPPASTTPPPL